MAKVMLVQIHPYLSLTNKHGAISTSPTSSESLLVFVFSVNAVLGPPASVLLHSDEYSFVQPFCCFESSENEIWNNFVGIIVHHAVPRTQEAQDCVDRQRQRQAKTHCGLVDWKSCLTDCQRDVDVFAPSSLWPQSGLVEKA